MSACGEMRPSVCKVPTKVATLARRRSPGGCAVKLNLEQSQKLLQEHGIWITEACDRCGRLLGSVCWTQRGEPGDWCSAECRDGVEAAPHKARQRACRQCGISLQGKRADSEFCSDVHRKRFAKCLDTAKWPIYRGNAHRKTRSCGRAKWRTDEYPYPVDSGAIKQREGDH